MVRPTVARWWSIGLAWLAWGGINASRLKIVGDLDWPTALRFGLPDGAVWAFLTPMLFFAARRFEIRSLPEWPRLVVHTVIACALAFVHSGLDSLLGVAWTGLTSAATLEISGVVDLYLDYYQEILTHTFHINVIVYGLAVGILHANNHARRLADGERKAAQLKAQLTHSRLCNLERQLRPHFLFSALHTISGLMLSDPQRSQRVLARLGELLRMSLRRRDEHLIELSEELDLVRAYLEVEQARFGDRLIATIDVPRDLLSCRVPVFLLQPLVENAVYHGVSRKQDTGHIEIRARRCSRGVALSIVDDGPGFANDNTKSTGGIGLANTRERLDELYGESHALHIDTQPGLGVRVSIEIPCDDLP